MVLEKFSRAAKIVKWNGGVLKSLKKLFFTDDLKIGKLVGCDEFGNRYYQNNYYFYGRNRWVEYSPKVGLNYDASQIPAEWFGWIHHRTDKIPTNDFTRPCYPWMLKHEPNHSGTPLQYVPYDTTRDKIQAWKPPKKG